MDHAFAGGQRPGHSSLPSRGHPDRPSSEEGVVHGRNHGDQVMESSRHGYPSGEDALNVVDGRACVENRRVHLDLLEGAVH